MPAKSAKQQKYMAMCAHDKDEMDDKGESCPPAKVAREFSHKPKSGYSKQKPSTHRGT